MCINIHQCLSDGGSFYLVMYPKGVKKKWRIHGLGDWELASYIILTTYTVSPSLGKTNLRAISESVSLTNAGARAAVFQIRCGSPPASSSDQNILPSHLCFSTSVNCVLPSSLRETMRRTTGMPIVNARRCFDCSCYDSFTLREYRHRVLCTVSVYTMQMTQIHDAPVAIYFIWFLSLEFCGLKNFCHFL